MGINKLIEFAKEQCEIFPEDSEMGMYLRETLKILQAEPCEDAVSRKFMCELGATCIAARNENGKLIALGAIENLPPVKPKCRCSENPNKSEIPTGSTTKSDLTVDCISRNTVLTLINDVKNANGFSDYSQYEYLFDQVDKMPPVTPQQKYEDIAKAFQIGLLFGFGENHDDIDRIIDEIKLVAPARKKGKWTRLSNTIPCVNCQLCGKTFSFLQGGNTLNFCPNCGAEMERKE